MGKYILVTNEDEYGFFSFAPRGGEYDPRDPSATLGIPACNAIFGRQEFDFVIPVHFVSGITVSLI